LIRLTWDINTSLPGGSLWQIHYVSQSGVDDSLISAIAAPTRAYTLTNLTNNIWYTVTLNAMQGTTPVLTDTVHVMPVGNFIYFPGIAKTP
jgi:hypothetical protein